MSTKKGKNNPKRTMTYEDTIDAVMEDFQKSKRRYGPTVDDFWKMINRNMKAKKIGRQKMSGPVEIQKRGYKIVACSEPAADESESEALIEFTDNDSPTQLKAGELYATVQGLKRPEQFDHNFKKPLQVIMNLDGDGSDLTEDGDE